MALLHSYGHKFMVKLELEDMLLLFFLCLYILSIQIASSSHQMITHLLFPVKASSVTVGDIDVTIRLENGELEATQYSVQQLPARSLGRKWKYRGKRWEIGGKMNWMLQLVHASLIWTLDKKCNTKGSFEGWWSDLYQGALWIWLHSLCALS